MPMDAVMPYSHAERCSKMVGFRERFYPFWT